MMMAIPGLPSLCTHSRSCSQYTAMERYAPAWQGLPSSPYMTGELKMAKHSYHYLVSIRCHSHQNTVKPGRCNHPQDRLNWSH